MNKICNICKKSKSQFKFYKRSRGDRYSRCKDCFYEIQRLSRRNQKRILVNELGGKCIRCGYNKSMNALEFHHKNPRYKKFNLSAIWKIGLKKARKEAKKCILLCANCHREIEDVGD